MDVAKDKLPVTMTLRISVKDHTSLKRLKRMSKKAYSELVREAIGRYLEVELNGDRP
jgi:hypothetical protein